MKKDTLPKTCAALGAAWLVFSLSFNCTKNPTKVVDHQDEIPSQMPQMDIPWPSLANSPWPMYLHDPQHTGRSPYRGPQEGKVDWVFETGQEVYSSPAIGANGTIYFGSKDGFLYAISSSGGMVWRVYIEAGTESSPLVSSSGNIYITSSAGYLYSLSSDGLVNWKFSLCGRPLISQPTISPNGDFLYLQTLCASNGDSSRIYSIRTDGTLYWNLLFEDLTAYSPALSPDGSALYAPAMGKLYAIDSSGVLKWSYKFDSSSPISRTQTNSPAVDNDGNVYVVSGITCWSISSQGSLRWKYMTEWDYPGITPTIGYDGTIYVAGTYNRDPQIEPGGYGRLYALDYSGKLKWNYDIGYLAGDKVFSTPAILDFEGTIYAGMLTHRTPEDSVNFVAITREGKEKFYISLRNPGGTVPDIDSTPVISMDGRIYVGSDRPLGFQVFAIH
jgi:outer membrane protein assembly factor BamB